MRRWYKDYNDFSGIFSLREKKSNSSQTNENIEISLNSSR